MPNVIELGGAWGTPMVLCSSDADLVRGVLLSCREPLRVLGELAPPAFVPGLPSIQERLEKAIALAALHD